MAGWKKICCAVDFSEPSRKAMREAADLARRLGADLVLVHAFVPPPVVATDMLVSTRDLGALLAEELDQNLAAWRVEAERIAGKPVSTALLAGEPEKEIVRYAREKAVDVIVLATHGRSGLKRLVMGSVADTVTRRASCPVLVVRGLALPDVGVGEEAEQHHPA